MATQQVTIKVHVNAENHMEALDLSGLKEPGALISVNALGGMNVRYRVDEDGKVVELGRYGSVE